MQFNRPNNLIPTAEVAKAFLLWVFLFLVSTSGFGQLIRKVQLEGIPFPLDSSPWKLVFQDEFEGNTLDTSRWITWFPYDENGGDECTFCRTHGAEGQVYRDENVTVDSGILRLWVKEARVQWMDESRSFSAGMVHTRAPWKFKYGRFEVRCRLPRGKGFWPAFWLYGWSGNEIDVFELGMQDPSILYTNIHKDEGGRHYFQGETHPGEDYASDFHVFTLEWEPWGIRWLVDGQMIRQMNQLTYRRRSKPVLPGDTLPSGKYFENALLPDWPLDIILNVAVGVDGVTPFTGSPDLETVLPAAMEIDYVRVYQR